MVGIDPGHGGYDPGSIGRVYGTREKDIALAIALKVAAKLKALGIPIYMTRTTDSAVSDVHTDEAELNTRAALLNNMKCTIAVSIHINSVKNTRPSFISTRIQGTGGEAEKLAHKVQDSMVHEIGWADGGVVVQNLAINRNTVMPSILVECGFLSNAAEEKQLRQVAVQDQFAEAIVKGIVQYLGIEVEVQVESWKDAIMKRAVQAGLIEPNVHKPDEPADKWFVLQTVMNLKEVLKND